MPANPDLFSKYKDPSKIKVSVFRKVGHSATNKFSSMTKKDVGMSAVEHANTAVTAVTVGASIGIAAGSTAAFAVALTGPGAGIALGIVGIALAAKAMYSNREAAHTAITPYMFSMIDSVAPTALPTDRAKLDKIGGAALALITDCKAQVSEGQSKLAAAEKAFKEFWIKYGEASKPHAIYRISKTPVNKAKVLEAEAKRQELITSAEKPGGAIFEYMRRLVHFGNYLQVFEFFGKVLKSDTGAWTESAAFGGYLTNVNKIREVLAKLVERVDADSAAYDEASR